MDTDIGLPHDSDLVLVREEETGWAHLARRPHGTSRMIAIGFLQVPTVAKLLSVLADLGYVEFARYALDATLTTFWFGAAPVTPPPAEQAAPAVVPVSEAA